MPPRRVGYKPHSPYVLLSSTLVLMLAMPASRAKAAGNPEWTSPCHFRAMLSVDAGSRPRSNSPAKVEIDFQLLLSNSRAVDDDTIEVIGFSAAGQPRVFDASRKENARHLLPHRVDRLFGSTKVTLSFVVPDNTCTTFAAYFDTVASGLGKPQRYHGLVGDGDRFSEGFKQREITASHFDQFVDFDGDGDLDLFKGGVEPYVYCYENVGGNRMVDRGRLSSGGEALMLPKSKSNRSWVTVAFFDLDSDGDQDFSPSFGDGPDTGKIIYYRNETREHGGQLTFTRVEALQTISGVPLAGGAQAGGWFPSVCFVKGWQGDDSVDAVVGSNNHCWLYHGLGVTAEGLPRFADAVAVKAGGADIVLVNPRFEVADIDGDGDLDLFAGTQPGPVHWFTNTGTRANPEFAAGAVLAFDGKYLIGDAHSGVKVADFDNDGLLDFVAGRFWERTDLKKNEPRNYGGFYRNAGSRSSPRFEKRATGSPFTEQFQPCDAIRQNSVRAVDWDGDGRRDLLAGDTDGFILYFHNETNNLFPMFAMGVKLLEDGKPLGVADRGGHARFDVCDWNNDSHRDVLVASGHGTLTLFLNEGGTQLPSLAAGVKMHAGDIPIQIGGRASALVCDWDNDGRKDVALADEKGYYFCRNTGTDAAPLLEPPKPITFGGKSVSYVRPNLGSFVDWDGDGKKDLITGHFENSIRFHRNIGSGGAGTEPQFADPEGIVIVLASSPQMISGADAVDWNGDGDTDILTGQGHGGSGLRFYERDWIEDELHGTHPVVKLGNLEMKP